MSDGPSSSGDVLGLRPYGEAVRILSQGAVDAAGAFLGRICLPAAEEFGEFLRDKVHAWRAGNTVSIANRAEALLGGGQSGSTVHAHPRLVGAVLDQGSWSDDDRVQGMWAGLLASACTVDGRDESNLMFVDLLARLTSSQARVFDYVCRNAPKRRTKAGWITSEDFEMPVSELSRIAEVDDLQRLDRELDHLRSLGLIEGGIYETSLVANIAPTALGLQMFARCQGFAGNALDFFGINTPHVSPGPAD